ncbi:ATP-binding protein [Thermopolyspora sp. NPDC052614]|uniref:ATP-binding protein n=1 Tax=Thermopolyspora sp. NPDC052614 TaxID=3155682 RepID=UPI003437F38A
MTSGNDKSLEETPPLSASAYQGEDGQSPSCRGEGGVKGTRSTRWLLQRDPKSVGEARRLARQTLISWAFPAQVIDDVLVVISELTANAIVHGGGRVLVSLDLHPGGSLTGTVTDTGLGRPRVRDDRDGLAENGRGLFLVDRLVSCWGVTPAPEGPGKLVWFHVRLPAVASPADETFTSGTAAATTANNADFSR